ncbi:MAG: hypothetical protein ACJA1J_002219 [Sulfitobacter pontiacus]|jgi:hypothetical protein
MFLARYMEIEGKQGNRARHVASDAAAPLANPAWGLIRTA